MREMTEATYNSIKNRMLTGLNKFNHQVDIANIDQYSPPTSVLNRGGGFTSFDMVFRNDGKIAYAYRSGNNIYAGVCTEEEVIESTSAWVNNSYLLTTIPFTSGDSGDGKLSLSQTSTKGLILLMVYGFAANATIKVDMWTDSSMTGLSFSLFGTVYSYDTRGSVNGPTLQISKISEGDGVLFFGYTGPDSYNSSYSMIYATIIRSFDGGNTWSRYGKWGGIWEYVNGGSTVRIKNRYQDLLIWTVGQNVGGIGAIYFISTDNGQTFTRYGKEYSTSVIGQRTPSFEVNGQYVYQAFAWRIFRILLDDVKDVATLLDISKWEEYCSLSSISNNNTHRLIENLLFSKSGNIFHLIISYGSNSVKILTREKKELIEISSISISKSKGGANTATLKLNNRKGVVNPRNPESPLYSLLNLNQGTVIKLGYGDDLVDSFAGIIDGIHMSTFPQVAEIKLRDNLKRALDQTVTKDGSQVVLYPHQPIEDIVSDLCGLCGLPIGLIEPTGISIEKEFNWQTYADAIQFLSDIASFEFLVDESGLFYFRRDYQPNDMELAWSFEEGVDIQDLTYEIDDTDIYKSIRVYGKSEDNVLVYNAPFLDAEEFNILPQKIMKIDATEASTTTELRKIAERAVATMRSRTRVIRFTAIAIPHLQVGDFIQLFESSTNTHEIYRLSAINLNMTKDSFTMSCTGYYYGDSIVPGDLPEDVATQTPDPTLNLIPNMTSNTKPSGVASSSSTYLLYGVRYSPWRAFNNDDTDYFWDLSTKTGWIAYEFPEKTIVDKYIIKARQDLVWNKALPRDWKFEAFDGTTWITLDTRTGETNWEIYEERSFIFNNTTPYAKYRLSVSANNGYVRTQIEQLSMYYGGGL